MGKLGLTYDVLANLTNVAIILWVAAVYEWFRSARVRHARAVDFIVHRGLADGFVRGTGRQGG